MTPALKLLTSSAHLWHGLIYCNSVPVYISIELYSSTALVAFGLLLRTPVPNTDEGMGVGGLWRGGGGVRLVWKSFAVLGKTADYMKDIEVVPLWPVGIRKVCFELYMIKDIRWSTTNKIMWIAGDWLLILASCYWGQLNRERNAQQKQTYAVFSVMHSEVQSTPHFINKVCSICSLFTSIL